jgi:hypothetical protein
MVYIFPPSIIRSAGGSDSWQAVITIIKKITTIEFLNIGMRLLTLSGKIDNLNWLKK